MNKSGLSDYPRTALHGAFAGVPVEGAESASVGHAHASNQNPHISTLRRGAETSPPSKSCAVFFEQIDYIVQVGISGAETAREPVSTALGNELTVGDYFKLAGLSRSRHSINSEAFLDEGRETRDLRLVILSSRAVDDLYLHGVLQLSACQV